jgi:hypothetical protein
VSIDLIRSDASFVLVTYKELKYMKVQSWDVGVGKRSMPQAIASKEQKHASPLGATQTLPSRRLTHKSPESPARLSDQA